MSSCTAVLHSYGAAADIAVNAIAVDDDDQDFNVQQVITETIAEWTEQDDHNYA
jgi:hypothetical protein